MNRRRGKLTTTSDIVLKRNTEKEAKEYRNKITAEKKEPKQQNRKLKKNYKQKTNKH